MNNLPSTASNIVYDPNDNPFAHFTHETNGDEQWGFSTQKLNESIKSDDGIDYISLLQNDLDYYGENNTQHYVPKLWWFWCVGLATCLGIPTINLLLNPPGGALDSGVTWFFVLMAMISFAPLSLLVVWRSI